MTSGYMLPGIKTKSQTALVGTLAKVPHCIECHCGSGRSIAPAQSVNRCSPARAFLAGAVRGCMDATTNKH